MRIGLVPISAKPYHAGHHALVTTAAQENDQVMLFISTSDRKRKGEFPILGNDMREIWVRHLEPMLPNNVVTVYGGSPVRKVYEELEKANTVDSENTYTVYSDPLDTARNYSEPALQKYCGNLRSSGQCLLAAEENPAAFTRGEGTPNISGTAVREMLRTGDFDTFASIMPPGVDAQAIFDILTQRTNEAWLRHYIQSLIRG